MKIVAVIAVQGGTDYLHNCLTYLQANAIKAVIIDNGLSGPGRRIVESSRFSDIVLAVEDLPVSDVFHLEDQLLKKEQVIAACDCDWVVHQDIDELLQSNRPGETLREAIVRADRSGANAINFIEMVFLPLGAPYSATSDGWPQVLSYYHFAPYPDRLMRARKKAAGLSMFSKLGQAGSGCGHFLFGDDLVLHEENLILRHYIVTDQDYARRKYVERRFAQTEIARGWHANRIGFSPRDFDFPNASLLKLLPHPRSAAFDVSEPYTEHFWQWAAPRETSR